MEPWNTHVRECRRRHGVSSLRAAQEHGVHARTWRRRTRNEGWCAPYPGVRIAPWAPDGLAPAIAACLAAHPGSALSGAAARWWRGLAPEPRSTEVEILLPHGRERRVVHQVQDSDGPDGREQRRWLRRCERIRVRRCRWLAARDVETVRGLRLVTAEVDAILLARAGPAALRAYLVDARHSGLLDLVALERRLATVGPVPGRRLLRSEIDTLLGREPESIFHDRVLDELLAAGYGPEPRPVEIRTPLGRDLRPDIALQRWQVAVELDGDRFHRDREQRRRDRDRLAAYASTSWRLVVVDWHSWHEDRPGVLAAIDAAIDVQRRLGIGAEHRVPGSHGAR